MTPKPTYPSDFLKGTYFADLSPCTYFGRYPGAAANLKLKAVGWLSPDHPYTKGTVSEAHLHGLLRLLVNPCEPFQFLGYQRCEFCAPVELPRKGEYSRDLRFVVRRSISDGVESFEILGPETEIFKRRNSYNPNVWEISMGVSNLFVPADGFVFAAPSMILHYIHAHGYDPPPPFWEAVMASSCLSFDAYKEALFRSGGLVVP
jgi:hypothetical protein